MVTKIRRGGRAGATLWACFLLVPPTLAAQELPPGPPEAPLPPAPTPAPAPQPRPPGPEFPPEWPPPPPARSEAAPPSPARLDWGAGLRTAWVNEMNGRTVVLTPLVELAYALAPDWRLQGNWAFSWLVDNEGLAQSLVKGGNPLVEARYRYATPQTRMSARLGVTLPIVTVPLSPDGRLHASLVNQNLAMTGMWNAWTWLRDYWAVPLQARLDHALRRGLDLAIEGALIPIRGVRTEGSRMDVMAQASLAVRLALTPRWNWEVLPRVQAVLLPSEGLDRYQAAVGWRVRRPASPYYLDALVNIGHHNGGMMGGLQRFGLTVGKEMDR